MPLAFEWSVDRSLDDMDRAGVELAILSMTTPGLWFGDRAVARTLARDCNEYAARLVANHPQRFAMFASLPMPDIDGTFEELSFALDTLGSEGVAMFTSYGDRWLGDPAFAPVFEELNRRKAIVYTHPTSSDSCPKVLPGLSPAVIEYGTDTTRTIASLVFSGAAARYPNIRFIFSHAGGTMPFLIERFEGLAQLPNMACRIPNGLQHELGRFFYDTAQAANATAMSALATVAHPSHILFGSDYPFREGREQIDRLKSCAFSSDELKQIERLNALALMILPATDRANYSH
jgi:predicted TIM-barrel fold metal-dependent hydrolase